MKKIESVLNNHRWLSDDSYDKDWKERSALFLKIAENIGLINEITSYTEYGCGPFAPLKNALKEIKFEGICNCVDIKKWHDETIVLDLNSNKLNLSDIEGTDCGCFSGVLEYLDNLPSLFNLMKNKHKILFVSYVVHSNQYFSYEDALHVLKNLSARANSGWRNHYSFDDLLPIFNEFGYISGTGMWGNQALFVLINKDYLNFN